MARSRGGRLGHALPQVGDLQRRLDDRVVSSRPRAMAYRVAPTDDAVVETPLEISDLGQRVAEPAAA